MALANDYWSFHVRTIKETAMFTEVIQETNINAIQMEMKWHYEILKPILKNGFEKLFRSLKHYTQ